MTTLDLHGADGSTWQVMGYGPQPVMTANGVGGLHLPHVAHQWTTTARQAGARWRGYRMAAREFTLNFYIDTPDIASLFFDALTWDETARLVANGERTLTVRLDEDNDFIPVKDPSLRADVVYPVSLVADDPAWVGAPQSTTIAWEPSDDVNYYGGGTGTLGPPFYIGLGDQFETASVANPGDLPAWPTWTITGPLVSATVGVTGATLTLPFGLGAGDQVIVDSFAQTITDQTGNNLWPQMGYSKASFAPIGPGDEVPVVMGIDTGAAGASITVAVTPRWRRAW